MAQNIILGIVFAVALFYLGRYIYRQIKVGDQGQCDKCLPKDSVKKIKDSSRS